MLQSVRHAVTAVLVTGFLTSCGASQQDDQAEASSLASGTGGTDSHYRKVIADLDHGAKIGTCIITGHFDAGDYIDLAIHPMTRGSEPFRFRLKKAEVERSRNAIRTSRDGLRTKYMQRWTDRDGVAWSLDVYYSVDNPSWKPRRLVAAKKVPGSWGANKIVCGN